MGGVAHKLKSDSGILGYLLLQPEPGLAHSLGTLMDPSGSFRDLGITDGMAVSPEDMATLKCMVWGLNPLVSRMAAKPSGGFDLRKFATAVWRHANMPERRKIGGQLSKKLGLSIATWDSPDSIARKLIEAEPPHGKRSSNAERKSHRRAAEEAMIVASRCVTGTDFCLTDGASQERANGYGHVLTTPREVSILYAIGDPGVRAQIMNILDDATKAALNYYHRYAGYTRARNSGATRDVPCHFIAVHYRHVTARPFSIDSKSIKTTPLDARLGVNHDLLVDPHLHSHILILNLARDSNGHFRSIESRYLLIARKGAEATFDATLAWGIMNTFGLTPFKQTTHKVGFGLKEIGADLVRHFVHRKQEVDRYSSAHQNDYEGAADDVTDKSFARTATRRRKERFAPTDVDRHWHLRAKALGLGPENVARFLRACRSSFGQDIGDEMVLDEDAIIAIVDQLHRKEGGTPYVSGEDIRVEVLHRYLGHADSRAILDICDMAMQKMVSLGTKSKKPRYATTGFCLLERNVFELAEQELPINDVLANLALAERQILSVDSVHEWGYRAASRVLSGNARARYLTASEDIELHLILNTILAILRSKKVRFLNVVAGTPESNLWAVGTQPLPQILEAIRTKTLKIANTVLILGNANSVPAHEMEELLGECERSHLLLIAFDRPSSGGGIFSKMLHNRILKRGTGIYRQISNCCLDPDDTKIAEMIRDGQANKLWRGTRLYDKLVIEETHDAAVTSLAMKFVTDRQVHPNETQLVMAISEKTMKQIRQTLDLKCREFGLPPPQEHEIVAAVKAEGRHCDRSYVMTEGQNLWEQHICCSRHRQYCFQVASIESLHAWLLDMTDDDPAVTLDRVRQAPYDILACQWSRRQKSSSEDFFGEQDRLAKLSILKSSAFATSSKHRLSIERLKIASEDLRQFVSREPEPEWSGITRLNRVHDFLAKKELPSLSVDLPARSIGWYLNQNPDFWNRAVPVFQKALRSLLRDAQTIDIQRPTTAPPITQQNTPREGTENGSSRIPITVAHKMVGRGALAAINRARRESTYGYSRDPRIAR